MTLSAWSPRSTRPTEAVGGQLRTLNVPTLLIWGTADANFPVKWAYHLRDLIPGRADQVSDGPPGALAMNVSVQ